MTLFNAGRPYWTEGKVTLFNAGRPYWTEGKVTLYLGEFVPLSLVLLEFLQFPDTLQRVHALVQQECSVIHQHVHKLDKLLTRAATSVTRVRRRGGGIGKDKGK